MVWFEDAGHYLTVEAREEFQGLLPRPPRAATEPPESPRGDVAGRLGAG